MPSFYFEQVLQTALNGIDQNITGPVLRLAGVILILSLLYAVYEAYSNGGDVRALGVAGIKYLVLGLLFLNYQQAFRSVNGMFNTVADFIYNTNGIGDVIQNWLNSVSAYINQQGLSSFWTLVTGAISGLLDVLLILIGLLILPVSYTLFTLAYAMYGSILYLVGPFVLALWPSRSMGQLSRTYFVNRMIFQSWATTLLLSDGLGEIEAQTFSTAERMLLVVLTLSESLSCSSSSSWAAAASSDAWLIGAVTAS